MSLVGASGLVGREHELLRLHTALAAALGGAGQVVLLHGEPGIGKTRLLRELAVRAAATGAGCQWGRAPEQEGAPPYWSWQQAFGLDALAFGGTDRFLAFEAAAQQVIAAGEPAGSLVVLDDLHWADPDSVALFLHVAQAIESSRVLLVGAYRDTEAGRADVPRSLAPLAGRDWVTHVRLTGLTDAAVAAQLAAQTGAPVDDEVVRTVVRRTHGNPFFVAELGRMLGDGEQAPLPDAVRAAVERRLAALPDGARPLLVAAAVVGNAGDPALLAAVTARSGAAVLDDVDTLRGAGLLDERGAIVHDLVAEAARAAVPSRRLSSLHHAAAAYLAGRADAEGRADAIASHLFAALPLADAGAAVQWAERAARQALGRLAWKHAAALLEHAAAVADDRRARGRLLRLLARAQLRGYDVAAAIATVRAAAELARAEGDPAALADAALVIEGFSDMDPIGELRVLSAEALAMLPPEDVRRRARLLARIALHVDPGFHGAEQVCADAVAAAEQSGDLRAIASALHARQLVRTAPDAVRERLALGARMLDVGRQLDDAAEQMWGRLWRFDALLQLGRLAEAEADRVAALARGPIPPAPRAVARPPLPDHPRVRPRRVGVGGADG